ncbi:hypothetical protein LUW75_07925 [Streptomyces sp. MRC013]|uniref:hypothetical protein n=1 Tax=Streptomyces sp. MRC013 TaxID=2898276 RepID=UPI0020272888|nr:hypothetical protein [Streptomyces sp. MRC013]URM89925.1 hypothetical protein LUW75_07925 [Streptomyces sp. MRC013]
MRPAHWGLAASAAGLAVGGVSVAAGTGVLPTLGTHEAPRPAVAASVPAGPEATDGPAATPRGSTGPGRASGPSSPPPLTPPASPAPPAPPTGTAGTATARGAAPGGGAPTGGTRTDDRSGAAGKAPDGTWPARTTQDCRDFRDGRIDAARRQQLELVAKASGGVRRFCDQVLSDGRRPEEPSADTGAVGAVPGTDAGAGTGDRVVGGGDADPGPGDGGGGRTAGKEKPAGPKPPVKGGGKAR